MDTSFYGFSDNPFATNPGKGTVFSHEEHCRARGCLEYELMRGTDIVVLAGRKGTGKHTLINDLLARYPLNNLRVGQYSAAVNKKPLLDKVAAAFGLKPSSNDQHAVAAAIRDFVTAQHSEGNKVILVVYDAENLHIEDIEALRGLTAESDQEVTLYLYLVGQPRLQTLMNAFTDKHPLGDAIKYIRLAPMLTEHDTADYITHRLQAVGWDGQPELSGEALQQVHHYSEGIAGRTNLICQKLLQIGSQAGQSLLEASDVDVAAREVLKEHKAKNKRASAPKTQRPTQRKTAHSPEPRVPATHESKAGTRESAPTAASPQNEKNASGGDNTANIAFAATPVGDGTFRASSPNPAVSSHSKRVLVFCLLAMLLLAATLYWDIHNQRRLLNLAPVASMLQSLGLLLEDNGPNTAELRQEAPQHTLPASRSEQTAINAEPAVTTYQPPSVTEPEPEQQWPPETTPERASIDEIEPAIANEAVASDVIAADIQEETAGLLIPLDGNQQPEDVDITPPQETDAPPPGPLMNLLLPTTRPAQRFIDQGLISRNGILVINPDMALALEPYAASVTWRSDGSLEVIPRGLSSGPDGYGPRVLQESIDGIAFVIRNYLGVGIEVRSAVSATDIMPADAAQEPVPATTLVDSRLRNSTFEVREVSLVGALPAPENGNIAESDAPAVRILLIPHR